MPITIATVNSRQVGVLDLRNAAFRRTNIGSTWLEARIGAFLALTTAADNDHATAVDSITPASYLDWFSFGLKDSSNNAPGKAGSQFLGCCWPCRNGSDSISVGSNSAGASAMTCNNSKRLFASVNGVTVISSADTTVDWNYVQQASGWACFMGIRFVVANAGLSNQTVQMYRGGFNDATNYGADLSKTKLRTIVNNITWASVVTANWFSGGVALPLPDYVWLRLPLNATRIRLANIDAFKIG